RRAGGLFGGLWEPPMVERRPREPPRVTFGSLLGSMPIELSVVGEQIHVLTHRKLRITIATADVPGEPPSAGAKVYDRFEWRASRDLRALGMSSLAKRILQACPGSE